MINKRGEIDFDDFGISFLIFAAIGGFISLIITKRMGSGIVLQIIGFVLIGIICGIIGGKIIEE